jgi:hypothetical protein
LSNGKIIRSLKNLEKEKFLKNKNFEKRKIESGILKIENWKNEKGKRFNLEKLMVRKF